MSNKIFVELDREELRNGCKSIQQYSHNCLDCKKEDKDLIRCVVHNNLICYKYKIKDQTNVIKPRFTIGDRVWIIERKSVKNSGYSHGEKCGNGVYYPPYFDEYYVGENLEIKKIKIECHSNGDIEIMYYFRDCGKYDFEWEKDCFLTKEKAQIECNKRNEG